MPPDAFGTTAGGAVAGILAYGLVQVAVSALKRPNNRNGKESEAAIARAIERQAVATEHLNTVLQTITERLVEHGEALRRLEVQQAQVLSTVQNRIRG